MIFADKVLPVIRDFLLAHVTGLESYECRCTMDERVHAVDATKTKFINVYPSSTIAGPDHATMEEGFDWHDSFIIGLTIRTGHIPDDRLFSQYIAKDGGLIQLLRIVVGCMRKGRLMWNGDINAALASTGYKLVEPYRMLGGVVNFHKVGPEHFNADPGLLDPFDRRVTTAGRSPNQRDFGLWVPIEYTQGRIMASFDTVEEVPIDPPVEDEAAFTLGFSLGYVS
jgi:hypothetical protein